MYLCANTPQISQRRIVEVFDVLQFYNRGGGLGETKPLAPSLTFRVYVEHTEREGEGAENLCIISFRLLTVQRL